MIRSLFAKMLCGALITVTAAFAPVRAQQFGPNYRPPVTYFTGVCMNNRATTVALRSGPSTSKFVISELEWATPVYIHRTVISRHDGLAWHQVTASGLFGYIRHDYVCNMQRFW